MALMGSGVALDFFSGALLDKYPRLPTSDGSFVGLTDPGVAQTLINYTVPANKQLVITQVFVACRIEGKMLLKHGSDVIGSGRTGAAYPKDLVTFAPLYTVPEGDVVQVIFESRSNSKQADVECYLQGFLIDN